ncbi:co-chaperone GroES [Patescibacteria group bacterium]|nr:co-chaperone GroES [Patescibacteria group bacterium]
MSRKKKLNLKPTAGYLVIEPVEAQTKTDSGIYLPESADEKPQKGRVLVVGPDEITEQGTKRSSPVKVGDVVIYKKWGGSEVKIDGVEYLFAKFEDILAVETA